jgi:hypothetical protein
VFFVAKALQAIGLVDVGAGLYLGLTMDRGMWKELELTLVGLVLFYAGRLLERRIR